MEAALAAIYYYPIKGLPGVALEQCELDTGERLPMDRRYALAPPDVDFDPREPRHIRKQELFVLMKQERLAELGLAFEPLQQWLTLTHNGQIKVDASLETPEGCAAVENCIAELVGKRPRLLSAPGHGFTDLADKSVSIINLASIRDLEKRLGVTIDKRRFRANLYIDGIPPWTEFAWLEEYVYMNDVTLKVYRITDRCAAINVDPGTAQRDRLLQDLRQTRGNLDMGVYATVTNNGTVSVGDRLGVPRGT